MLKTLGLVAAAVLFASTLLVADDGDKLLRVDHYVRVKTTVPVADGHPMTVYVREVVQAGTALRGAASDKIALFVHGAGTPGEVSFDATYENYSWAAYLANAGFDVFAMDMTGYGRSTRPWPMNDPCNLSKEQQAQFVPQLIPAAPCTPSYGQVLTTIASDWHDLDSAIDYIRALRHVDKVSLLAWSLGGPRAGGYAAQHPEKVDRMVLLAPAYNRGGSSTPPAKLPADGATYTTQTKAEFAANWDRQVGCPNQYEPAAFNSIWQEMLESDPVGSTWGPGVRRAPAVTTWGYNNAAAAKTQIPTLMVSGAFDKQVNPDNVRNLYSDLAAPKKIFVDLACSSHMAMWEKNRVILFKASLDWLTKGTVDGKQEGMLKLGY
jgi:pimeloyl-ACP methyl ester carboxylesterase